MGDCPTISTLWAPSDPALSNQPKKPPRFALAPPLRYKCQALVASLVHLARKVPALHATARPAAIGQRPIRADDRRRPIGQPFELAEPLAGCVPETAPQ